jgi:hypothetical protein
MTYITPEQSAKSAIRSMELALQMSTPKDRGENPAREIPSPDASKSKHTPA